MRDFHATPELCPPPAASADIARRRLLTAVAAAPVIAVTPAFAERRSDDADAEYLAAFAASLADRERETEYETPEEVAAARRRHHYLADTVVATLPGAVAKLAFAADEATDYHQINSKDQPLPRALASLRASLPALPQSVAAALTFAAEAIESSTVNHSYIAHSLYSYEIDAEEWKKIDDIFERTGANTMMEERRRQHVRHDSEAEVAGELSVAAQLLRIVEKLDRPTIRMTNDKFVLMGLAGKIMHAMTHLGRPDQLGSDSVALTMRFIARDFAAAADQLAPPVEPVAFADLERLASR